VAATAKKADKPAPAAKDSAKKSDKHEKAAAKSSAKPSDKPSDKPAPKTTDKPSDKPSDKASATATATAKGAKPAAKAEPAPAAKGKPAAGKKTEDEGGATAKRAKPKKPVTPTGPRHPKLGYRWACYRCDAKFYDLGKDEPICPKCGADQRDRPADEPRTSASDPSRPRVVRPMAQLLDDDEPVAPMVEDDLGLDDVVEAGDMFEGDGDITHLELDAADLEGDAIEASETDEF
jgi:hypothetical protein